MNSHRLVNLAFGLRHRERGDCRALWKTASLAGSLTSSRRRGLTTTAGVLADTRLANRDEKGVASKSAEVIACAPGLRVWRVSAFLRVWGGCDLQRIHPTQSGRVKVISSEPTHICAERSFRFRKTVLIDQSSSRGQIFESC